jgi:hypothetical protein
MEPALRRRAWVIWYPVPLPGRPMALRRLSP